MVECKIYAFLTGSVNGIFTLRYISVNAEPITFYYALTRPPAPSFRLVK